MKLMKNKLTGAVFCYNEAAMAQHPEFLTEVEVDAPKILNEDAIAPDAPEDSGEAFPAVPVPVAVTAGLSRDGLIELAAEHQIRIPSSYYREGQLENMRAFVQQALDQKPPAPVETENG